MVKLIKKCWYAVLKDQDVRLGALACHAMKLKGYSSRPIHPKHLFDEQRTNYLEAFLKPGISFLDIGSGVGTECKLASKLGARIVCGVEYDWASLRTANGRICQNAEKACLLRLDLEKGILPFRNDSFDLINFTNVLEHIVARREILCEVKRVKKTGGLLILSVPNAGTRWKKKLQSVGLDPRDDDDHKIEYSKESLNQELTSAGLRVVSDYLPIIPSFPWNGMIAMSAFVSPKLYKWLQIKKKGYVQRNPENSTGWIVTVE